MKKRDENQPVVIAISENNFEEYIQKIESNGGKIAVPKFPVLSISLVLYFNDPDGNLHGKRQEDRALK